jgi:hypothetical protein
MRDEISKCEFRIKETEENTKKLSTLEGTIQTHERTINACDYILQEVTPVCDDLQEHITKQRRSSLHNLNRAIRMASLVIPDSIQGVQFKFDGKEAWLETPAGTYADRAEGSGFKGSASIFLRGTVLGMKPEFLQTMVLDEPLSKVSTENSASLSTCLPLLVQDKQVILIEQKKEIYSDADCATFRFFKENGFTVVVRED